MQSSLAMHLSPRCGAKTRRGTQCKSPAMANGRCRMHGGPSTGPKTAEGVERIRAARTKHGRYSQAAIARRREARSAIRAIRALLKSAATTEDEGRRQGEGHRQEGRRYLDESLGVNPTRGAENASLLWAVHFTA